VYERASKAARRNGDSRQMIALRWDGSDSAPHLDASSARLVARDDATRIEQALA
jgi:hypothetical protein